MSKEEKKDKSFQHKDKKRKLDEKKEANNTKDKDDKTKDKSKNDKKEKEEEEEEEELTEEDKKLKEDLELLVLRTSDVNSDIVSSAIIAIKKEIRSSTSSMTSVPKPLKFLTPHYDTLKAIYEKLPTDDANKGQLADVLSWLGMTIGHATRDCLNFKLKGTGESVSLWGHEYVRHLCLEVGEEYLQRTDEKEQKPVDDLLKLVDEIVQFLITHNAEIDACDILMEVEQIDRLVHFVDESNYKRVALYMESCASYLTEPDDAEALKVVMKIFHKINRIPETLRIALALSDKEFIKTLWTETTDPLMKKQLAYMLAQHGYFYLIEGEEDESLQELMGNVKRTEYFQHLAKDLDIVEPKLPEDIYKSHLTDTKRQPKTDAARPNLASTLVNAFVNAGFSKDKLIGSGVEWIIKNREHGRISAAASVGLICLWETDLGPNELDKYTTMDDDNVKAGVVLGQGIVNCNVRTAFDIAFSVVSEHLNDKSSLIKQCSALGLGLAYAGSTHEQSCKALLGIYEEATMEVLGHIALALGLINVGSCNPDLSEVFVTTLLERGEAGLKSTFTRFLCLGLGLLYLGKQEAAEIPIESCKAVPGVWGKYAVMTLETCAYAGTGNVLKIQSLLAACGEHILEENENGHQAVAVLGIALVALREEVGRDMVVRSFDHLLQYGEANIRRAVPLALGILSVCNPDLSIMDTLSKFSHDNEPETAMGAIFALGLIGAGTNNSRIAQLLRGLASYHWKDNNLLFIVRLAQGILHMGKGTISISPYHHSNGLIRPTALAGLLATIHTCFDFKGLILAKSHYLIYTLALAMFPRMLMTFSETGEPISVPVRVGQAVDVIGKAGNPKTITGFQTHNTPVLLGVGDRAELATDEYVALSPFLEGCVILNKIKTK